MTTYTLQNTVTASVALQIDIPPPASVGCRSLYPFTLYLSAEDNNEHKVQLYAQGSNSSPWQIPQNKWSHLIPQWRFLDVDGNVINELIMPSGYVTSAQFYYIDDSPTSIESPVILWAIVDYLEYPVWYDDQNVNTPLSGFSNSKVGLAAPYYINGIDPVELNISRDGINSMFNVYWKNGTIPHVVSMIGNSPCSDANCNRTFIHYIPTTNAQGILKGPLTRGLTNVSTSAVTWTPTTSTCYFSAVDENNLEVGGYIRGYARSTDTAQSFITAAVSAVYTPVATHTPYLWISNPENNTINKIYNPFVSSTIKDSVTSYFEEQKFINDPSQDIFNTPQITTIPLDNPQGLSGFGGIYGIAVDPCYNVWTTDSEQDTLYKFDVAGSLISSIDLTTLPGAYIPALSSTNTIPFQTAVVGAAHRVVAILADGDLIYSIVSNGTNSYFEIHDKNGKFINFLNQLSLNATGSAPVLLCKYNNYIICFINNKIGSSTLILRVINIDDPTVPFIKGTIFIPMFPGSNYINDIQIVNNRLYIYIITATLSRVLYFVDLDMFNTWPVTPGLITTFIPSSGLWYRAHTTFSNPQNKSHAYLSENYKWLYITDGTVHIFERQNLIGYGYNDWILASNVVSSVATTTSAARLYVNDNYMYIATSANKLAIYDVTDGYNPSLITETNIDFDGVVIKQFNDHLFTSYTTPSAKCIQYSYISAKEAPTFVGNIELSGSPRCIEIAQYNAGNIWIISSSDWYNTPYYHFYEMSMITSEYQGSTPAGISLDKNLNMWVALTDTNKVLKFDKNGQLCKVINPGGFNPTFYSLNTAVYGEDTLYKPTLAETDSKNNVWISYTNALCSCIVKYDSFGNGPCATLILPMCATPMDMIFDYNGYLYVTLTYHAGPEYKLGAVYKYRKFAGDVYLWNGSVTAVNPEYITSDFNGNIWFTENFNTVTQVPISSFDSRRLTHYYIGTTAALNWMTAGDILEYNALEGIASDVYNRIFVINSIENTVYQIVNGSVTSLYKINPDENLSWYILSGYDGQEIYDDPNEWTIVYGISALVTPYAKSAQAFGDWTGSRWITKYTQYGLIGSSTSIATVYLTGQSSSFVIEDFAGYDIRRFNESWNGTDYMKGLYVQPHIQNNPVLWDGVINSAFGTDEQFVAGEGDGGGMFGRASYERTANFVKNRADINESDIESVYSLADEVDVPIDDYAFNYPPELKRIMDIISISPQRLWGARCPCNKNIENEYKTNTIDGVVQSVALSCIHCGHLHAGNKGTSFNAETYTVTAYHPFIVKDNYLGGNYILITPSLSCFTIPQQYSPCLTQSVQTTCVSVYPLSASYFFILPDTYTMGSSANNTEFLNVIKRFCFYDYVNIPCGYQIAGVINWGDSYTTLNENASTVEEWYGEGQTVDKILNYALHKGLGLITD